MMIKKLYLIANETRIASTVCSLGLMSCRSRHDRRHDTRGTVRAVYSYKLVLVLEGSVLDDVIFERPVLVNVTV